MGITGPQWMMVVALAEFDRDEGAEIGVLSDSFNSLGGMATDMLVAAGADWSGGPFCLDGAVAPAPEAGPGRSGPATPADRTARGDPLAGPGLPA